MPWKEVGKVERRLMFIAAVESGGQDFKALCEEFGISRTCGYKWLGRYRKEGLSGLKDRSRRPLRVVNGTEASLVSEVVSERRRHPVWGARKLRKCLERRGVSPPSERTVNRILKREGLVVARESCAEPLQRFERPRPNDLWQLDHKRAIHGSWSRRSVPFVVVDDHSRYLLCLRSLPDKGLVSTWSALWDTLGDFGLPRQILSDNDAIFHGRNGPSQFEVRLMRLGIKVLHGRTYHPQTQGKVERLNGTLELELLRDGSFRSADDLQSGFERFRRDYNFVRPHESLAYEVPGSLYRPSPRPRPSELPLMDYASGVVLRKVQKDGWISWKGYRVSVGQGLHGERVEVRETDGGVDIYYGPFRILGEDFDKMGRRRVSKVSVVVSDLGGQGGTPLRATPSAEFPPA